MRRTAARLLNALPGAVIVASMITLFAVPAEAAARMVGPAPYVVAIDPGHGGSPDNEHPERLFDPGSVSGNGLVEKDLTLDVARRLQRRLEADQVRVVMTRSSDRFVAIPDRMTAASDAGAQLFLSIHFNFFQDATVGGSVILYPRDSDRAFAQTVSDAMAGRLARFKVTNGGVTQRDNLWAHAPMPAVTVEAAYLTNKAEADLLTTNAFKDAIAASLVTGIEVQQPGIQARKAEILKYRAGLHAAAAKRPIVQAPSLPAIHLPFFRLGLMLVAAVAFVRYRRATIPALAFAMAVGSVLHARASGRTADPRTRRGVRRRRTRAPIWTGARPY
ncbi:MAG: N-acetylmuramoyl-L-alanine amidase [Candidatus Dormibacteria bacterium]